MTATLLYMVLALEAERLVAIIEGTGLAAPLTEGQNLPYDVSHGVLIPIGDLMVCHAVFAHVLYREQKQNYQSTCRTERKERHHQPAQ